MPKAQQMNIQRILSIFRKKKKSNFERQMQLKLPWEDENVIENLQNIKSHKFILCWESQYTSRVVKHHTTKFKDPDPPPSSHFCLKTKSI